MNPIGCSRAALLPAFSDEGLAALPVHADTMSSPSDRFAGLLDRLAVLAKNY